ncbi:UDP-glucose--(glucosyl) LPS alpha 1,3-glucosyltransferase WaaO [Oxalobacteraceae bacterium CAVE-383]|nr:UDP-glucose--(glucosyl) LPS alpha 1,3-glucosyltransferase WaaO [Oxalobacteraceae bacterium CAVE-383]
MNRAVADEASFHIAFCVDNHYFRAMGATIASIIANNPARHFTFHVLAFEVADEHRARLAQVEAMYPVRTELHLLDLQSFRQFSHFLGHSHYSLSTFTRLVIPAVLRERTGRVLYLDADILCVGSLDDMIAMDIGRDQNIAAAAPDAPVTTARRVEALQLPYPEYFNGGVLFINIERWIAEDITAQTLDALLNSKKELRFNDQDALNIVLNGRVRYISPRWNYLYDLIHDLDVSRFTMRPVGNAVFIHFAGAVKPWADWSGHDARHLFRKYLALSPWAGMPLDPEPRNTKEMRMHSRFLFRQGKPLQSLKWYIRYLNKRAGK